MREKSRSGCGHPFTIAPILLVGGPAGAGKSTVLLELVSRDLPVVLLDMDTLWMPYFDSPETGYREFFEAWLRIAKSISRSGRPCVLFGGGGAVPHNIEPCVERRYFASAHYLALVADDEVLATRLRRRPAWRESSDESFITANLEFSHWLQSSDEAARHEMTVIDTSASPVRETADAVEAWIRRVLPEAGACWGS